MMLNLPGLGALLVLRKKSRERKRSNQPLKRRLTNPSLILRILFIRSVNGQLTLPLRSQQKRLQLRRPRTVMKMIWASKSARSSLMPTPITLSQPHTKQNHSNPWFNNNLLSRWFNHLHQCKRRRLLLLKRPRSILWLRRETLLMILQVNHNLSL